MALGQVISVLYLHCQLPVAILDVPVVPARAVTDSEKCADYESDKRSLILDIYQPAITLTGGDVQLTRAATMHQSSNP